MLRFTLLTCLIAFATTSQVFAQQPMEDVVYLKHGGVVRGIIIEQIPDESLKIQTRDGNVLVFTMDEITRLSKDFAADTSSSASAGVEIGTQFGLSHFSSEASVETSYEREEITGKITLMGVPGGPLPSLYVLWFPSERLSIGPEFSFWRTSFEGEYKYEDKNDSYYDDYDRAEFDFSTFYLGCRVHSFLQSNAVSGPYLLANGALMGLYGELRSDDDKVDDSERIFAAGAGLGYQWRVGPAFVVKAEGRYRRWFAEVDEFESGLGEFSLTLNLGTRLGGR